MTLNDCIHYKTRYVATLERQGGAINRERIRYLKKELETMHQSAALIQYLQSELHRTAARAAELNEMYLAECQTESLISQLFIKHLSQHGKRSSSIPTATLRKPAGSIHRYQPRYQSAR
ncbi:MAG: hypothetical protein LCH81_03555 [Bacteroidetes bacterium]|nr:hypothetical protein [Bacteroidota bacterium]